MVDLALLVATRYLDSHPAQAAAALEALTIEEIGEMLSRASTGARLATLRHMNADIAAKCLVRLAPDLAKETLSAATPVRTAQWLALVEEEGRQRLLDVLPAKVANDVREALRYPPGTAGYYLDPATVPFRGDAKLGSVISMLRGLRIPRITDVMVTDDDERLIGVVSLQALVVGDPEGRLDSLVQRSIPVVHPMTTIDEVVELLNQHRLASLPVVDLDQRLLGVIRHDSLVRAVQDAAGGDLLKMVGAASEERALSSPSSAVRSRLPWLLINLLTAFAAAAVVGIFDATIASLTALAVLLPVVAGQSGNTGAQALAVTSRALALREIRVGHWLRVVRKEVTAAFVNGLAVATITGGAVWLWSGNFGLCGVIASSMVVSMVFAAMSGAIIPIILTSLGRDPATASSIILTTITDIIGFFSFLGLATLLLAHLA